MAETPPAGSGSGKLLICPYCGDPQPTSLPAAGASDINERCRSCSGLFEPLSRQATHNAMGPWFVRDPQRPFQPGCSYETLVRLVQRGKITRLSIIRGPTTRQFWTIAKRVPGIAHLLGFCHECAASVDPGDHGCHACGVSFGAFLDRNYLGLPEYRPLPWERDADSDDPRQAMGLTGDDPMSRTWHGLPTIREADGPQPLSSFATDEELRGNAGLTGAVQGPPAAPDVPATAMETITDGAAADGEAMGAGHAAPARDRNSEVAIRLMRRKVSRQQKTIVRLTVLSTALAFLALVMVMGWVSAIIAGAGREASPVEAALQQSIDESAESISPALADDSVPPDAPEHDEEPVEPEILEEPAIAEEPGPVDPARLAEVQPEYERALSLIEAARDEDRPLAEAIADCEEAVAILTRIRDDEPRDLHPPGLDDRLAHARRQLERLRLREFFP